MVSQKCQYALRATFELAKFYGQGPTKIADIAEAEAIPARFLEVILGELKQGGFVQSRRGREGGYMLARDPREVRVGEVIRFVEGPIGPVGCVSADPGELCALHGDCVFLDMWEKVREAVADVYDGTTFQDLVEADRRRAQRYVPTYSI
ncbi:MAG: RrF2 family transcriptional regulator [Planctomycetota bacterium]|jgi:Rrf2 family protein